MIPRLQGLIGVVLAVVTVLAVTGPATASPSGTEPAESGSGTVAGTQAQVSALETQIAAQQQLVTTLSEQFDRSTVHLQALEAQLVRSRAELQTDRAQRRADELRLRRDAVSAYVDDAPLSELNSLFSSTSATGDLHKEYEQTAIGNVGAAVAAVESNERELTMTEQALHNELTAAESETASVRSSRAEAEQATAVAETTLSEVKGQLAQMVAARAAQNAAFEAAAARAAATAAARRKAAAQAAEDAQVAETVGAGTPVAAAATTAANQAASESGSPGAVGTGAVQSPSGGGGVALAAAERYLGVPYEYGGASGLGLDCSGLTMLAWQAAGVALPHSAADQRRLSRPIPLSQVQPGDLLFYDLDGDGVDHVVMYVGSGPYGSSTILQAAHTGTVVEFDPIWYFGLVGAGRP